MTTCVIGADEAEYDDARGRAARPGAATDAERRDRRSWAPSSRRRRAWRSTRRPASRGVYLQHLLHRDIDDGRADRARARPAVADDDDDGWVGEPPEGRHTRDAVEPRLLGQSVEGHARSAAACVLLLILVVVLIVRAGVATGAPARTAVSAIASMIVGQAPRGRPWPMPGISTSRAPGIAFAVARPPEGRTSLSSAPWMTVAGTRQLAQLRACGRGRRRSPPAGAASRAGRARGRS